MNDRWGGSAPEGESLAVAVYVTEPGEQRTSQCRGFMSARDANFLLWYLAAPNPGARQRTLTAHARGIRLQPWSDFEPARKPKESTKKWLGREDFRRYAAQFSPEVSSSLISRGFNAVTHYLERWGNSDDVIRLSESSASDVVLIRTEALIALRERDEQMRRSNPARKGEIDDIRSVHLKTATLLRGIFDQL